jgi:hypothetical protein
MPKREELEIEIDASGETKVHIKGVKGKACMEYTKLLEQVIGKIKKQDLTSEYYEPPADVEIVPSAHRKTTGR